MVTHPRSGSLAEITVFIMRRSGIQLSFLAFIHETHEPAQKTRPQALNPNKAMKTKPSTYRVKTIRGVTRFQSRKNALEHAEFIFKQSGRYVLVTETPPGGAEESIATFKK